jgi:hypothetical protein
MHQVPVYDVKHECYAIPNLDVRPRAISIIMTDIDVYWDEDELDWEAYEICLQWCEDDGIHTIADLAGTVVSVEDYERLWLKRCREMQEKLKEKTMSILDQLSSQVGDRTEKSNRKVVAQCLTRPALLAEIADGLASKDAALIGDCAEVLTEVAKEKPELAAPHAKTLAALLTHKTTRVRWEAMHALALMATAVPKVIASLLPRLREMIHNDASVIVRDHAVDAVSNYAKTSKKAAQAAHPILLEASSLWNGKQAGHALNGLANVTLAAPNLADELHAVGIRFQNDKRGVVRKAAKALIKATGKS